MIGTVYAYIYVVLPKDGAAVGEAAPLAVGLSRQECRDKIAAMKEAGKDTLKLRIRRARASIYSS